MRLGIIGVAVVGMAVLMSTSWGRTSGQEGQRDCTVTVEPGQSVQKAIDEAPEGAVVCLGEGVFMANVVIAKSITLRGLGREQTILRSREPDRPVLFIRQGEIPITVQVERLHITGARSNIPNYYCMQEYESGKGCAIGVIVRGSISLSVRDVRIDNNDLRGLDINGLASVSLQNVLISSNGWEGIAFFSSGSLTLQSVEITDNYAGFFLTDGSARFADVKVHNNRLGSLVTVQAQLTLEDSQISGSQRGLTVAGVAHFRAVRTRFFGNIRGLVVVEAAHVTLERVIIENNIEAGLDLRDSSKTTITKSTVEANGAEPACASVQMLCSGVLVQGEAQVTVQDSIIHANADWGLAAALQQCGYSIDDFSGRVTFLGETHFEGNNTTGNQSGQGNPGDHPFTALPDGQVCLP